MNSLADKYADKADFMFVYTVDAHPDNNPGPYDGTKQSGSNRQPKTYSERVELATRTQASNPLSDKVTLVVDDLSPYNTTMNGSNPVWCRWGPAPNPGWVIQPNGTVVWNDFWFDAEAIDSMLESLLSPTPAQTTPQNSGYCHSISAMVDDGWCAATCATGFCPTEFCQCDSISV